MANGLVGTIEDTQGLKNVDADVAPIFKIFTEEINAKQHSTVFSSRSVSGTNIIWGNTLKAWGTPYVWGNVVNNTFVLGNSGAGRLGSDKLGSTLASFTILSVINPNGIWYESLRTDTFKDSTNTTATWDTTNFRWTFAGSDQIQTEIISWNQNTLIQSATLALTTSQITNPGNLTYYLSADDGTNWETVTNGTHHFFTNTGYKLKLKITASGSAQIDVDDSDENSYPVEVRVNQ